MAKKTSNYNLEKQQLNDYVDIEGLNENFDIIDEQIKNVSNKADQAFQSASNGKAAIKTAITGVDPKVTVPTDATFQQLATAIGQIKTGVNTDDATSTAEGILAGLTAYVKGKKVTGTMPYRDTDNDWEVVRWINVDEMWGMDQNSLYLVPQKGYYDVDSANVTDPDAVGCIVARSADYVKPNIAAGKTVFGKKGTFSEDATAAATDMLSGKTAYVKGTKITGNIPSKTTATYNPSTSAQTIPAGQYLSGAQTVAATTGTATTGDVLAGKTFNSANGIGLTGTIPVTYADLGDSVSASGQQVYDGWDGNRYAISQIKANAAIFGANWVRSYQPDIRSENILAGKSIFGVAGTAVFTGKKFASGITRVQQMADGPDGNLSYQSYTNVYLAGNSTLCYFYIDGLTFKPSTVVALTTAGYVAAVVTPKLINGKQVVVTTSGIVYLEGWAWITAISASLPCSPYAYSERTISWYAFE